VRFAGFREGDELLDLLGASDVFVFPTLGDPYGLVVDEAMAAGLPVISSDAAGEIRSRVVPDVTGAVVPSGDARALAGAMIVMASDHENRRRMGEAAAASMVGRTPDFLAETFDDVVAAIVRGDRRAEHGLLRAGTGRSSAPEW
jgi:glycosyltransferase involved in cell wall biosynthesis